MNDKPVKADNNWWEYLPPPALTDFVNNNFVSNAVRIIIHALARIFFRFYNRIEVHGNRALGDIRSAIIVANHSSHFDIPALFCSLSLKTVNRMRSLAAKDYFFRNPVLRTLSFLVANIIPFDRDRCNLRELDYCGKKLKEGCSMILFPEGTRTTDGNMHHFLAGVGMMAMKFGVPVIPVYIDGTYESFRKGSFFPAPKKIRVFFGEKVSYGDLEPGKSSWVRIAEDLEKRVRELGIAPGGKIMNRISLKLLKLLVKTVGMSSNGIRMSFKYGFTSGKMLDYVYANEPSGRFLIGKAIDRLYLSHRGWEAVRIRKQHLEQLLEKAILDCLARKGEAFILDIASGPARYVVDTLAKFRDNNVTAICRDLDERWLREGREKAAKLGLKRVSFEKGDALDFNSYGYLYRKPDIVISSGFYDWIKEDSQVNKSMSIAYRLLDDGGYFIYTNQSAHVDIEMVNEIFIDFRQQPLRMVTRSVEKLRNWAVRQGFAVSKVLTDSWGYYPVTLVSKK
jgi:1-acyl-sn-glycerol-3-phosphate acyltransferase